MTPMAHALRSETDPFVVQTRLLLPILPPSSGRHPIPLIFCTGDLLGTTVKVCLNTSDANPDLQSSFGRHVGEGHRC